jgi:hypothetical protein
MTTRITVLALALGLAACGSEAPPPTSAPPPPTTVAAAPPPTSAAPAPAAPDPAALAQATEMGTLARTISRDPDHATAALEAAHLTPAELETRVYAIASDPTLSAAYRTALDAP